MYIRIPTGFKTLSIEAKRTGIIEYRCTKCGKVHLQKINAATRQSVEYHVFGGEAARLEAENKLHQMVTEALYMRDKELFDAINVQRDYSKIHEQLICPICGEKQIWSVIPKPWKKVRGFDMWICGMIFFGMFSSIMLLSELAWWGIIPLSFFMVLLALPAVHERKRKRILKIMQETSFQPPKYYNYSNIQEIENREIV